MNRLSVLEDYLNNLGNDVIGFSLEKSENGFLVSLMILRVVSIDGYNCDGTEKVNPVFTFESGLTYEEVCDKIIATMKLKR